MASALLFNSDSLKAPVQTSNHQILADCSAKKKRSTMESGNGPPEKRRKTDSVQNVDDWGDDEADDFFFSQCVNVLDNVEASQQVPPTEKNNNGKPRIHNVGSSSSLNNHIDTKSQGYHSMQPSVSGNVNTGGASNVQIPNSKPENKPIINKPSVGGISRSNSVPNQLKQQTSSKPDIAQTSRNVVNQTGYNGSNSAPKPSTDKVSRTVGSMGKLSTTSVSNNMSNAATGSTTKFTGLMQEKMTKVEEENSLLKTENKSLKDGQYSKDGQIKFLRSKVAQLEGEKHREKQNKILQKEKENKEQNSKEKQLQKDLEKMKSNLQFKDRDFQEMQERCKMFERQMRQQEQAAEASPSRTQQPFTSPVRSPGSTSAKSPHRGQTSNNTQQQKGLLSSPSTPRSSQFPTKRSFLGKEVSPRVVKPLEPELQRVKLEKECSSAALSTEAKGKKTKKMKLDVHHNKGTITGAQLVSRLFDADYKAPGNSGLLPHPGIIGLLQNSVPLPFRKDRDPSHMVLLTPPSRSTTGSSVHSTEIADNKYSVTQDKINQAQQAVSSLLAFSTTSTVNSSIHKADLNLCNTQKAMQLIPMIENYLQMYINIMQSVKDTSSVNKAESVTSQSGKGNASTTSQNNNSQSGNSSTSSSWASSLKSGMFSSHTAANKYVISLENQTLSALGVLDKLITHCKYMRVLLANGKDIITEERKNGNVNVDTASYFVKKLSEGQDDKKCHSGEDTQGDLEKGLSNIALEDLDKNTMKVLKSCDIMVKLIKLADPFAFNNKVGNISICKAALRCLTSIAESCGDDTLKRFNPLLRNEGLLNCFRGLELGVEEQLNVATTAVSLITTIAKSADIVPQLCSQDDQCLLLHIYHTCLVTADHAPQQDRLAFCQQLFVLLSTILSTHEGSATQIFEADCRCSFQVVKCVSVAIHRELHENSATLDVQAYLRTGLSTLYLVSSKDRLFTRHHEKECKHEFLETVCGLNKLLKNIPDVSEQEMTLVYELWDFDQEQSSEDDINMDILDRPDDIVT